MAHKESEANRALLRALQQQHNVRAIVAKHQEEIEAQMAKFGMIGKLRSLVRRSSITLSGLGTSVCANPKVGVNYQEQGQKDRSK